MKCLRGFERAAVAAPNAPNLDGCTKERKRLPGDGSYIIIIKKSICLGVEVGGASVIRLAIHVVGQVHEEGLLGCLRARKHLSKETEVHAEAQVDGRCSRISGLSCYLASLQ